MSRLPTPGSDDNTWGDILNDFLGVSINTDGSIKTGVVGSAQIADGSITTTDISATAGIVKTQLASAVQTSLGRADTALQSVPDATTTAKGIVQLAGDLGGTAAAPTTPTAVHLNGAETITGVKTFSVSPIVPAPSSATAAATRTYADSAGSSVLAYWDGLNNPTVTGQSFPLATLTGNATYVSGSGVRLTDAVNNQSGQVYWDIGQAPFMRVQFNFKAGTGSADSVWFFCYADAVPTTEYGSGLTKGYIVYFSEYATTIGITYGPFTDGNQKNAGGVNQPLAVYTATNINNNVTHAVDVTFRYNRIIVRYDGVIVINYADVYTRDTSNTKFGFGSRTGGQNNTHFISGLVVSKLGQNLNEYGIQTITDQTPDATTTSKGIIQLTGDLAGTATSPALATTGVTAGSYGSSGSYPIITIDAKGRITAANSASPSILQTYSTTNTATTYQGQWTKVANQVVTAQYGDAQLVFMIQNNFDAETDGSVATIRMRTKQQSAFGANPLVSVAVLTTSGSVTSANLMAIVTQNTPTTSVDLYLQINEQYRTYLMTALSITTGNSGTSQLLSNQSYVATGSLPAGTLQVSGKYDPTNPATSTVTGGLRLTGDLGGTATAPTTPTAVHITGSETIAGAKTFTGTVTVPTPVNTTDATTKTYVDSAVASVTGGLTQNASQTANFTAAAGKFYPVNAASGAVTVTLPTSSGTQFLVVKKMDASTNTVTLSGTINGTSSATLALRYQNQAKELIADGGGGWTVALGDLDVVTTLATSTLPGFIQLAGDLAGTAASPVLAATTVTAGSYGSATTIPTFTVDSKGRLTAAANQAPFMLQSYITSNTSTTDNGKWTKIATQTVTTRYNDAQASILLHAGFDDATVGSLVQVRLRTKQQDAFGNNPIVEAAIVSTSSTFVPANIIAVITQNTPSSIVDFYIQIAEFNRNYGIYIESQINTGSATTTFLSTQGFVATGSLPAGVLQVAGKYDQTNPASATLTGGIRLTGDIGGSATAPLVAKLNGVTLSTTAPTTGQVLQATSATTAAWGTATATDNTKVAKSGDTMTGSLTMPNTNAIKVQAVPDVYQWFYADATGINQVPFGETWHDLLAFNKLWTVTMDTTTNGSNWTSATVNKKVFAHLENQSIQIIDGTIQGVRWTFSNAAYAAPRWLMIAYAYVASSPNVIITTESSSDGSTWTTRQNASYSAGPTPVWHSVLDNGGDGYLRIRIQSTTQVNISSIRLYSSRWGDQGAGKELEQPYTWNENGYIGIGKGTTAPSYPLDVVGDASVTGQIHNVTNPTAAQDAATKAYVDASATGGGSAYAVDVNSIGIPIVGANGITVTETASAITIGYSGSGGSSGSSSGGNISTYTSVSLGTSDGSTNAFTVGSGSFVTLGLNSIVSDAYSNFSTSTYQYTVPATGTYMIAARVRVVDGDTSTANFGIGVHTTNNDGYWFKWNTLPGNTNRKSFDYTRVDTFNQGDKLRLFAYSSSSISVNTAGLQIIRIDSAGGSGGSGGTSRSVVQVSSAMTAAAIASTDYVYFWTGSTAYTLTLPTGVGNTNRYTLKNNSTVSQVVMTTASQTIDGTTTITMKAGNAVDVISDGANWMVI